MKIMKNSALTSLVAAALVLTACHSATHDLVLDATPGVAIAPTMYGIFLEDINYAADGGLYAEMVENNSFEFPQALQGWDAMGLVEVNKEEPFSIHNPHYATLCYPGHHCERTGLENRGFFGFGFREGMTYDYRMYARLHKGSGAEAKVLVELVDAYQNVLSADTFTIGSRTWAEHNATFRTECTTGEGKLRMCLLGENAVDIDYVSLMPQDNLFGLRCDLVETLRDLHPGIFRFPGGCIVEGTQLESRYQWKNSVGPRLERPLNKNRWNNTFEGRYAPNYYQSYGLGFYEYFLLAEYIGASPIPVVNVGLSCQFHNSDEGAYVPVEELGTYVQDALDLIEFANGDTSTKWGALRAEMGHPAPFNLKIIGVGNEQWGEPYPKRLEVFLKAIAAKYPEIEVVGTPGPFPDGELFDFGWEEMRRLNVAYVDEHYYKSPKWFLENAARYDDYDRNGPKVFAGEYAAHIDADGLLREPCNKNCFEAALAEAAFMTGLERNADVVRMTAYAPLLAHAKSWQWDPDLIWFDNLRVVRTPNYYVQQLYSAHSGTHTLGITENGENLIGQGGLYASACYNELTGERIIRLVNVNEEETSVSLSCENPLSAEVYCYYLHAQDADYNSLDNPDKVVVQTAQTGVRGNRLTLTLLPKSFYVLTSK